MLHGGFYFISLFLYFLYPWKSVISKGVVGPFNINALPQSFNGSVALSKALLEIFIRTVMNSMIKALCD